MDWDRPRYYASSPRLHNPAQQPVAGYDRIGYCRKFQLNRTDLSVSPVSSSEAHMESYRRVLRVNQKKQWFPDSCKDTVKAPTGCRGYSSSPRLHKPLRSCQTPPPNSWQQKGPTPCTPSCGEPSRPPSGTCAHQPAGVDRILNQFGQRASDSSVLCKIRTGKWKDKRGLILHQRITIYMSDLEGILNNSSAILTPISIRNDRFLKLILLEQTPLLTCFGFVTRQKRLVSRRIN